tara:strand:- start:7891 stop:8082 length:192 start_codon:yes stop_codon:yes gene_type:complete
MNDLEYFLKIIWVSQLPIAQKYLNFLKLYNKRLANIELSDDIINMIENILKEKSITELKNDIL